MELMLPETDKLSVAIKAMLDEVADKLGDLSDEGVFETKIEEIPHEGYDGFVPWTNGGWTGTAYVNFRDGKYTFDCIAADYERDQQMMREEFRDEIRGKLVRKGRLDKTVFDNLGDQQIWDAFPNNAAGFEEEWDQNDDDVFFLIFRAVYYSADNYRNKSGEDEIYFFAGVNTDYNYGRDSISWMPKSTYATEYEQNTPIRELTPEKIAEIKTAILDFFGRA